MNIMNMNKIETYTMRMREGENERELVQGTCPYCHHENVDHCILDPDPTIQTKYFIHFIINYDEKE